MKFYSFSAIRPLVILFALTAGTLHAELPAEAQVAIKKGVIAAQQQNYLLACRFFQDARKFAPDAPEVFYNLGLAESRIPGRELRAMAWFGAYLAAHPGAPNAAAVKEQIDVLDVKNQSNTSRFIKQVHQAAGQISGDNGENPVYMSELWAKAGDITVALRTADLIQSGIRKSRAQEKIAIAQANAGDIYGAQMTTALIQSESDKSTAQVAIADAQARSGDFAGAQETADRIHNHDSYYKSAAQLAIARTQAESGDIAGAQKTADLIPKSEATFGYAQKSIAEAQAKAGDIANSLRTADLIQDVVYKRATQIAIASVQAKAGDIVGALKTADLILGISPNGMSKYSAQLNIAVAQTASGDIIGALKTTDRIQDAYYKRHAQSAIAEAQLNAGDIPGAQKTLAFAQQTADLIQNAEYRSSAQRSIAQSKAGIANATYSTRQSTSATESPLEPVINVTKWLERLDDDYKYSDCPLNTEPFLDLASFLKSLPPSDDPKIIFKSLHETAKTVVTANNIIAGMLKQQAKQQIVK